MSVAAQKSEESLRSLPLPELRNIAFSIHGEAKAIALAKRNGFSNYKRTWIKIINLAQDDVPRQFFEKAELDGFHWLEYWGKKGAFCCRINSPNGYVIVNPSFSKRQPPRYASPVLPAIADLKKWAFHFLNL